MTLLILLSSALLKGCSRGWVEGGGGGGGGGGRRGRARVGVPGSSGMEW